MIIWAALLIPIFSSIILLVFWHHKIIWWELLVPLGFSLILITISKLIVDDVNTRATEYITGYVTRVNYFEDWNERVHCRHPRYCTRCSGSGKHRSCSSYICGYHHPYDVDYHPEYWEANTNIDMSARVSKQYFENKVAIWNNKTFRDMHRSYHTNDGDSYFTTFDNLDTHLDEMSFTESYVNKIKNSSTIFNYKPVTPKEIEHYGLYDYPGIDSNQNQKHILGYNNFVTDQYLKVLNGRLGWKKQVKFFILVYKNKDIKSSMKQEALWKGGNKNEVVLTIGIDDSNNIQWVRTFTWSKKHIIKSEINSFMLQDKVLNLDKEKIYGLQNLIDKYYIRRNFSEFDYITIEPSTTAVVITFLLTILLNIGLAIFLIKNEFDEENERRYKQRR